MLKLYNTLTRREEEFIPQNLLNVRMYVCGPTVYDAPHIGNARSVVVYDVLYRLLKQLYPNVTYVRNITDVDDKINASARERGISIQSLTEEVIGKFHADMDALGCLRPSEEPRATRYIAEMIAMIETLIAKGHAYAAEGHVLFSVATDANYGELSRRSRDDMIAGSRVEIAPYKKDPMDFVLWKPASPNDDPSSIFDSPWSKGRPGWHIECSAMSTKLLGPAFDLHGGGADLMFPHHENEIAQSRCATGESFAKYWVHNGFLTVNGEKMSKSLGNFITVRELLDKGVKGEVIRYALLSTHYRKPLDWTEKLLEDAKKAMDYFYGALAKSGIPQDPRPLNSEIEYHLSEDLNITACFAYLHNLAGQIHKSSSELNINALGVLLWDCGKLLGLFNQTPEVWFKGVGPGLRRDDGIDELVQARTQAKKAKNWAEADRIRNALKDQGIILEDRPDGTTDWRRA